MHPSYQEEGALGAEAGLSHAEREVVGRLQEWLTCDSQKPLPKRLQGRGGAKGEEAELGPASRGRRARWSSA